MGKRWRQGQSFKGGASCSRHSASQLHNPPPFMASFRFTRCGYSLYSAMQEYCLDSPSSPSLSVGLLCSIRSILLRLPSTIPTDRSYSERTILPLRISRRTHCPRAKTSHTSHLQHHRDPNPPRCNRPLPNPPLRGEHCQPCCLLGQPTALPHCQT